MPALACDEVAPVHLDTGGPEAAEGMEDPREVRAVLLGAA
jgi:hypothetical protein